MIYYHGTNVYFKQFDLSLAKEQGDFGAGAYLTDSYEHARSIPAWKRTGIPYVFTYEANMEVIRKQFRIKEFRRPTVEWLDFIAMNRLGMIKSNNYDIIIGPTADAKAQFIVDKMYSAHLSNADKEFIIKQLNTKRYGKQVCIKNEKVLPYFRRIREEFVGVCW